MSFLITSLDYQVINATSGTLDEAITDSLLFCEKEQTNNVLFIRETGWNGTLHAVIKPQWHGQYVVFRSPTWELEAWTLTLIYEGSKMIGYNLHRSK